MDSTNEKNYSEENIENEDIEKEEMSEADKFLEEALRFIDEEDEKNQEDEEDEEDILNKFFSNKEEENPFDSIDWDLV